MSRSIVSFADGKGNYLKAMSRLENSLRAVGFDGKFYGYSDYDHIGSPKQNEVPYAFKPYSIAKADGQSVLWCDSAVYAIKPVDDLFRHIEKHGYVFFNNIGFSVGDYTSDSCLNHFGISRAEAFKIPMIMACCMGINRNNPDAMRFFNAYYQAANDGVTYHGDWINTDAQVSYDLRVKGHRHDQSVASILIHQMGLNVLTGNETFFMYFDHLQVMPKADTVCLLSQGL